MAIRIQSWKRAQNGNVELEHSERKLNIRLSFSLLARNYSQWEKKLYRFNSEKEKNFLHP